MSKWPRKLLSGILQRTETVNPAAKPEEQFDYVDVSSVSNVTFEITETQRLLGKEAPSRARKLIRKDDVLFATIRPTLRRIALVPEELDGQVCSTGYFVLRAKPEIDPRFLFHALFRDEFIEQMEKLQKGASYPAVTDGDVRAQSIPLPPLAEQRRIVGILDEAFAGIAAAKAHAEQNRQNARALFESHLHAVFTHRGPGWVEKTLQEAVESNCSLSYGIVQPGDEFPNGLPIVRPTDLTSPVIYLEGLKRIDPSLARGYDRTTLFGGELLLCVRGSTGTVAITAEELAGANVTRGLVPIRFRPTIINQVFGFYAMTSHVVQDQIRAKTYGTALMQINIRDLRDVIIPMPPLLEQKKVTLQLDSLFAETRRLEALYARKLAALDELKAALLHQAFSRQL